MPREDFFGEREFEKEIHIGESLQFDKTVKFLRIELNWFGTDLDVCAFLLDDGNLLPSKESLVYYNSELRWKTELPIGAENFNPLKGEFSRWDPDGDYKNIYKWRAGTLPVSPDGSVIGSWDDASDDEDEECQEVMHLLLEEVDQRKYKSIVFAATIAKDRIEKGETFEEIKAPVARIINAETGKEMAAYKLDREFPGKDIVCFGKVKLNSESGYWEFEPMDDSYKGGIVYLAKEVY